MTVGLGSFGRTLADVEFDAVNLFRLGGGRERAAPSSRRKAFSVHDPSSIALEFEGTDAAFLETPRARHVMYQLHLGTVSRDGSLGNACCELTRQRELGVTASESLTLAQYPGTRNWDYDGVHPTSVEESCGRPSELQNLVGECHRGALSLSLDVVFDRLGSGGNFTSNFGSHATTTHWTCSGEILDLDGPYIAELRSFLIKNTLQWLEKTLFDERNPDPIHTIFDNSAFNLSTERTTTNERTNERAAELGRHFYVTAKSDLNAPRQVNHSARGIYPLDSMCCDDIHQAAHASLPGKAAGCCASFSTMSTRPSTFASTTSRA